MKDLLVMNNPDLDQFCSELMNHSRNSAVFLNERLLEIIERHFDLHNMGLTFYQNNVYSGGISHLRDVSENDVRRVVTTYRQSFYHKDILAKYVSSNINHILEPEKRNMKLVQLTSIETDHTEMNEYMDFLKPYYLQDVISMPIDESARLIIYWRKDQHLLDNQNILTLSYIGQMIRVAFQNWKAFSQYKSVLHIKNHVIEQFDTGLAILDEKMHLIESNMLFDARMEKLFHVNCPQETVQELCRIWSKGITTVKDYDIDIESFERISINSVPPQYFMLSIRENEALLKKDRTETQAGKENRKSEEEGEYLDFEQLTKREMEVLKLFCEGMKSRSIADKLFISEWTVKAHLKNIYKKVGAKNQRQLINEYYRYVEKT